MLNLDTHIVVAILNGSLSDEEYDLVSIETLAISSVVLWELAKLVQLKRLVLDLKSQEFRDFLRNVMIVPITLEVALESTKLDLKSDPADEIICATSIVERIPLLTRDQKLLKSKRVPLARL